MNYLLKIYLHPYFSLLTGRMILYVRNPNVENKFTTPNTNRNLIYSYKINKVGKLITPHLKHACEATFIRVWD